MKTKSPAIHLGSIFNLNQTIFVISILLLTVVTQANQCSDLFQMKTRTKVNSDVKEYIWSNNSDLFLYKAGADQFVIHTASKKEIPLGHDRIIFSNEGNSVSVFSTLLKKLITYSGTDLAIQSKAIDADFIVDIRGQSVIAERNQQKGFFIFSLQTGELLHHVTNAGRYLNLKNSDSVGFVTEPNIVGLAEGKVIIEKIELKNLTAEHQKINSMQFDQVDPNYKSDDFLKVKSGNDEWLIRKTNLSKYKIDKSFIRAYDVDPEKKIFVIQTTDSLAIYKNGELDMIKKFNNPSEIEVVGYSQRESVYLAYDAKREKLFSMMTIWDSIQFGPDADITFFKPKMVGQSTILFQKPNGQFYRWGLRENQTDKNRLSVATVPPDIAKGVSDSPRFVAYYNKKTAQWEFKEIVMGDKK